MGSHAIPRTPADRRRDRIRAATVLGVSAGTTLLGAGVMAAVAGGIAFPGTASGDDSALQGLPVAAAADVDGSGADALRDPGVSRDEERQPLPLVSDAGTAEAPGTATADARQQAAAARLAGAADAHAREVAAADAERVAAEQAAAAAAAEAERVAAEEATAAAAEAERAAAAGSLGVDPDSNRGIAAAAIGGYGWGSTQFECLNVLWQRESNWDHLAENPSSGAYGIPQSLPARKMASVGSDYRTNPATQITWGLDYIEDSYGTPCNAWAFWQNNNWY